MRGTFSKNREKHSSLFSAKLMRIKNTLIHRHQVGNENKYMIHKNQKGKHSGLRLQKFQISTIKCVTHVGHFHKNG